MKNITRISIVAALLMTFCVNTFAQDNRAWWNSLSPAWKKVFQDMELKGKDVEPTDEQLNSMVGLTHIECNGNQGIEDLKPLARLSNVIVIDCSNTNIKSLTGIENLRNLTELDCSNNDNINSLIPVTGLINLISLNCGNTMVKSLAPLTYLKNLRRLDVHLCTINSLAQVGDLKSLTYLNVSQNHSLFSLAGIEKLTQLADFDCSDTNISDLTPLANIKAPIETLNISATRVTTLRPLQTLRTIIEIDISNTKISAASLDYFTSHTRMKFLRGRNLNIEQKELDAFSTTFVKRNPECDVILTKK